MKISQSGIDLIKKFEGLRLEAYQCSANVWTIGYVTTNTSLGPVKPGMRITESEAENMRLRSPVFRAATERHGEGARVPVAVRCPDELDLQRRGRRRREVHADQGTERRELPASWRRTASKWNRADGQVNPGLVARRTKERNLFLSQAGGATQPAPPPPVPAAPAPSIVDKVKDAMSPLLIPAISAVVEAIPSLMRIFKGDSKTGIRAAGVPGGDVGAHARVLEVLANSLDRLPAAPSVPLPMLAWQVSGDPHVLDGNTACGRYLQLAALELAGSAPIGREPDGIAVRRALQDLGVILDRLSSTTITTAFGQNPTP